jgi:peptide/nickel transport system ATP-binding protein/oligopeptide transport system ATP-binding protein
MIDRCHSEAPQLKAGAAGHLTACHRADELPPANAIIPSDGSFSPVLERLVAAFNRPGGSEPGMRG